MWRDFDFGVNGATTFAPPAFAFPEPQTPNWRQLWDAIVRHVEVTPDDDTKDALLDALVRSRGVRTLGFVNANALNCCAADPQFAADLLALDSLVRDGVGVQALYRIIGARPGLNLNGTDLLPELIARFAGERVAVFGTQSELAERVAGQLRRELGCETVSANGFHADGYYVDTVARTQPALVILGMGMPKQERVARLMKQALHQDVAIVCGGAILDFLSGHVARAPLWMRRLGLEWMFRLGLEPKRLFRRYVIGNPLFLLRSAILALRGTRTPAKPVPALVDPEPMDELPYGIGRPLPAQTVARLNGAAAEPASRPAAQPLPLPVVPPIRRQSAAFSANRPVVERDDLYGRSDDLARLQARVLDQRGSALIYGPRGYGKTSLVRVFGEVADSLGHLVIYASCSRGVGFDALLRVYLTELAEELGTAPPAADVALTVQAVAATLAGHGDRSIVFIFDEFDRVERDDTRESVVELIKDTSDLTGSVRFLLVGVATDAAHILGYHPSVHRCLSCVPLARLSDDAIATLFRDKARIDQLDVPPAIVDAVVAVVAGSAYHAQLIGQKLANGGPAPVDGRRLDATLDEIVIDSARIDAGFARLAGDFDGSGPGRAALMRLAAAALHDPDDIVRPTHITGEQMARFCAGLVENGVLIPAGALAPGGYRFVNAFTPQLLTILAHRADVSA